MKNRILISTPHFNKKGGIERYNVELIHFLSKFYEIDVLCMSYEPELVINNNINPIVVNFPKNRYVALLYTLKFGKYISNFLKKNSHRYFRIISSGLPLGYQDFIIAHSCHKARVKFMFNESVFTKTVYDPANLILNHIEGTNYQDKSFGKVLVVSNFVANQIKKQYSLSNDRVIAFHSGVNVNEFGVDESNKSIFREEIRNKYNISEDEVVMIFVAHEFKRKGLDYIVDSLDLLIKNGITNFKLFVIGKDNPEKFRGVINKYGLENKIIFTGLVGNDLRKYYFASDIFLFPTRHDPFPLVVMEAMASSLPIIITKTCGNSEIIDNYKDGIVLENLDAKNIYENLKKLISDKELRTNIGNAAKSKIFNSYTWDIRFNEMKKIFEDSI